MFANYLKNVFFSDSFPTYVFALSSLLSFLALFLCLSCFINSKPWRRSSKLFSPMFMLWYKPKQDFILDFVFDFFNCTNLSLVFFLLSFPVREVFCQVWASIFLSVLSQLQCNLYFRQFISSRVFAFICLISFLAIFGIACVSSSLHTAIQLISAQNMADRRGTSSATHRRAFKAITLLTFNLHGIEMSICTCRAVKCFASIELIHGNLYATQADWKLYLQITKSLEAFGARHLRLAIMYGLTFQYD